MNNKDKSLISTGDLLIEAYKSAQLSIATVDSLKSRAEQTEHETLSHISSAKPEGKAYVTPQDIDVNDQHRMLHTSLNAHFHKVQAGQIEKYSEEELIKHNNELQQQYKSQKAVVRILDPDLKPLALQMYDPVAQRKYFIQSSAKSISGTIERVILKENTLVLKPKFTTKLFNKQIDSYYLYVINPSSLEPLIRIDL